MIFFQAQIKSSTNFVQLNISESTPPTWNGIAEIIIFAENEIHSTQQHRWLDIVQINLDIFF
jgi:hypothetical protein